MDLFSRLLGAFRMQRKMVLKGISGFTGEKMPLTVQNILRTHWQYSIFVSHAKRWCREKQVQNACRKGQYSCRSMRGKERVQG